MIPTGLNQSLLRPKTLIASHASLCTHGCNVLSQMLLVPVRFAELPDGVLARVHAQSELAS